MEEAIRKKLKLMGLNYIEITDSSSLKKIHDLYHLERRGDEPAAEIEYLYFGLYYYLIVKDYSRMKKYTLMAVEMGNTYAMNNLAHYYWHIEHNGDLRVKYLLRSIECGNVPAHNELGEHYQRWEINIELMFKYYHQGIELNCSGALNNLASYYYENRINPGLMKTYYLRAIELGNSLSITNLGFYYQHVEKNYELMLKYYLMGIEQGNPEAMDTLAYYYETKEFNFPLMIKYCQMAIKLGFQPSLIRLENHYLSTPTDRNEPFALGIEHQRIKLITQYYHPHQVHQLTRVTNHNLHPVLIREKNKYIADLFHTLRQDSTWFHPSYCVKDVMEMVQQYIKA